MAKPFGFLNKPTAENTKPRIHNNILTPGAHDTNKHNKDNMKPVRPIPFLLLSLVVV